MPLTGMTGAPAGLFGTGLPGRRAFAAAQWPAATPRRMQPLPPDRTINGLPGARRQRLQQPVGLHAQQVRRGLQVLLCLRLHHMGRTPSLGLHDSRIPAAGSQLERKLWFALAQDVTLSTTAPCQPSPPPAEHSMP